MGWCSIMTHVSYHQPLLRFDTSFFESQAILLDCRNFDPDAKKGTTRDVEAGCVLAKFEKGQQKHHNNIYNNIENILSKKVLCLKCRYHMVPHFGYPRVLR